MASTTVRSVGSLVLSTALFLSYGAFSSAYASSNPKSMINDSAITLNIKAKMAKEPGVSGTNISVETNDGLVMLSGSAKTDNEAVTIVQIAESTEGVKDVDASGIKVDGGNQPLTDAIITAKVKGIFVKEKILSDKPISVTGIKVETKDGVVYLSGDVKNKRQADNAISLAKTVSGVKKRSVRQ